VTQQNAQLVASGEQQVVVRPVSVSTTSSKDRCLYQQLVVKACVVVKT
jgi:hypothetical protein